MDKRDAVEVAYKNGYKKGYEDGKKDAVGVVRCKDCIFCTDIVFPRCRLTERRVKVSDYCSRGERREGE